MAETLILWGVPSAVTGLAVWWFKRFIERQEAAREEHDKKVEKLMLFIMQTGRATNVLAEATARAVQRIPDAKCNGDMESALKKATAIQREEKDFLVSQGIEHIFEN